MKTGKVLLSILSFMVVTTILIINSNNDLDKKIQYVKNEIKEKVRSIELVQGIVVDMPAFRGSLEFQSFGQIDVVVKRLMGEQILVRELYILDDKLNVVHAVNVNYQDVSDPGRVISSWDRLSTYALVDDVIYTFKKTSDGNSPAYVMIKLNVGQFFNERMLRENAVGIDYKINSKIELRQSLEINSMKNNEAWLRYFLNYLKENFLSYLILSSIVLIGFVFLMRLLIEPFQRMLHLLQNLSSGEIKSVSSSEYPRLFKPFIASIIEANERIINAIQKERETDFQKFQFKVAQQVAHDIRSPLSVMKSLRNELAPQSEKTRRIVHLSLNRIEEITLNLLKTNEHIRSEVENRSEDLLTLLENILIEKRVEFRNHENVDIDGHFTSTSYGLHSQIRPSYLRRIISNIINNSVEACGDKSCLIKISLNHLDGRNVIELSDNGPGIAKEFMPYLFEKGFTTKPAGNGLGLSGAKEELDHTGGTINVESVFGEGVSVKITLLPSTKSSNLAERINLYKYQKVIILDDDFSIHGIWDKKLVLHGLEIEHYYSPDEIFKKYQVLDETVILLSDFEFVNDKVDGIDVINKLGHSEHSILVTARSEEQDVRKRCEKDHISFISKSLIPYVEINFKPPMIILIDDDQLSHWRWRKYCEKRPLEFIGFYSIDEFLTQHERIEKSACILLDSDLGNGVRGEIEGERISRQGYGKMYLYTSYPDSTFEKPNWIKEVVEKDPEKVLKIL